LLSYCPGSAALKGPQELKIKLCPECGSEIELFSRDTHSECDCGFVAHNDSLICVRWCAYARECVGEELYEKFANRAIIV